MTANTTPPYTTYNWTSPVTHKTYKIPVGFGHYTKDQWSGGCDWLTNPAVVSQYELFSRVLDTSGNPVAWKGCVEARPSKKELAWLNANWGLSHATTTDWDVSDRGARRRSELAIRSLFLAGRARLCAKSWNYVAAGAWSSATKGFHNNYMQDSLTKNHTAWGDALAGWNWQDKRLQLGRRGLDSRLRQSAQGGDHPRDPGRFRLHLWDQRRLPRQDPAPHQRSGRRDLQDRKAEFLAERRHRHFRGADLGVAHALAQQALRRRPGYNAPGVQKVIVLMTDGVNELIDNNGNDAGNRYSQHLSDYTAYGYLGSNRMAYGNQDAGNPNGLDTFAKVTTMFDNRLAAACANVKAAGIKIYTVTFNHAGFLTQAQQNHAAAMLQACATKPEYAFLATDSQSLTSAFASIASSATAGPPRLVR